MPFPPGAPATPSSPPAPPLRRPLPRPSTHLSTSGHKRPACSAVRLGGGKRREVASRPGHAAVWARVRPYATQALLRIQGCTVAAALVRATTGSKLATKCLVLHELAVQCGCRQPSILAPRPEPLHKLRRPAQTGCPPATPEAARCRALSISPPAARSHLAAGSVETTKRVLGVRSRALLVSPVLLTSKLHQTQMLRHIEEHMTSFPSPSSGVAPHLEAMSTTGSEAPRRLPKCCSSRRSLYTWDTAPRSCLATPVPGHIRGKGPSGPRPHGMPAGP